MKIKTLEVGGFHSALKAMRNPLDSWAKSDSKTGIIGRKDMELSYKLAQAGAEHAKHLRMIVVWADITAPREWLIQLDTYRVGVEKVSCSTMHTLMKRPLTVDDFENDSISPVALESAIAFLNSEMELYNSESDPVTKKVIWRGIIQLLPQSYLQKRTYMFSYAALRNIYRQREGHKLKEWEEFREWCESLPESWMITDKLPEPLQEEEE